MTIPLVSAGEQTGAGNGNEMHSIVGCCNKLLNDLAHEPSQFQQDSPIPTVDVVADTSKSKLTGVLENANTNGNGPYADKHLLEWVCNGTSKQGHNNEEMLGENGFLAAVDIVRRKMMALLKQRCVWGGGQCWGLYGLSKMQCHLGHLCLGF